ncbi:MAG: hypothetical protein GY778_28575 [bacterium]|nr:hypothetical protein [bacterium]
MDDQDPNLLCPQCGYNLRGIPEDRCPECGFGYDRAAIRSIASAENWERDRRYCRTICWSALAAALIVGPVSARYLFGPPLNLAVALLGALGVVALGRRYGNPRAASTWSESSNRETAIVIAVLLSAQLGYFAPAGQVPATMALLVAWALWVTLPSGSPSALGNATPQERILLNAHSRLAMLSITGATILIVLAWWRL